MALDDTDDDLFDAAPAKKKASSGKIVYQPPNANWSLDRVKDLQSYYESTYKKPLPLANRGQGSIHNRWGYDHRNSADVSLNPATPEGKKFGEYLRSQNIPFLAFERPIPGVATGPHYHIGYPSKRTTQKFNVGAQQKAQKLPSEDLFEAATPTAVTDDSDLFEVAQQPKQKVSRPTSRPFGQVESAGLGSPQRTVGMGDVKAVERVELPRRERIQQQVAREQAAGQRALQQQPTSAAGRLYDPRLNQSEEVLNRITSEREQEAEIAKLEAKRPEIDALKQKFREFGGAGHRGRLTQSLQGALANTGVQSGNLISLLEKGTWGGGESGKELTEQMRLAQVALGELEAEDPDKGWIAAAERALPGAGFELAKMVSLSKVPVLGRATLPGLGALSEADRGVGPAAKGAVEGEIFHRGFQAMGNLPKPAQFAAGTAVPAGIGIAEGQDPKQAILSNTAFGAMALATPKRGVRGETKVETQPIVEAGVAVEKPADVVQVGRDIQRPADIGTVETLPTAETPRHVDLQPRRQRGDGKGQFKPESRAEKELRRQQVQGVEPTERPNLPLTEPLQVSAETPIAEGATTSASTPSPAREPWEMTEHQWNTAVSLARRKAFGRGSAKAKAEGREELNRLTLGLSPDVHGEMAGTRRLSFSEMVTESKRQQPPAPKTTEGVSTPEAISQVPESPATIAAQMEALQAATRTAVLVPEGTQRTKIPQGMEAVRTSEGVFYFDPAKVSAETIKQKVADGTHGDLLDHVAPKPALGEPTATVTAKSPEGVEVQSSAVPPERAQEQAAVTQAQNPDAKVEVGGNELAQRVVADRLRSTPTAPKNATMAVDAEALGLPELQKQRGVKAEEVLAEAKRLNDTDPRHVDVLIGQARKGGRNFTNVETMLVNLRAQEVKNRHAEVMNEIYETKDPNVISEKRLEADMLLSEFDRIREAQNKAGAEWGRAGVARQREIDQDFSLIGVIGKMKAAKGRDLKPEERQRYEQMVKERDQAIVERDAAIEAARTQQIQRDITRSQRRRQRTETKEALDAEAAMIKQNIAAEFARIKSQNIQASGLAGLDPEGVITRELIRYARNRVKANISIKAEALVDEVHGLVSDYASRREIAELISGYRMQPPERQPEDVRRLREIRSEIQTLLGAEDVAAGIRTEKPQGVPRELFSRNQRRLKYLQQQEAEFTRRLEERDFSKPRRPEPLPYTREVNRAQDRVIRIENEFRRESERANAGHQLRNISAVWKSWLLSSPSTQVMNIAGTGSYQAFREISRIPSAILDAVVPGKRSIQGASPSAMLESVIHATKVSGRDAIDILKHGAPRDIAERHQYQEIDFGVRTGKKPIDNSVKAIELAHNVIFRFMSASDRVFYRGAERRNLLDRATVEAKNEGLTGNGLRARMRELVGNPTKQLEADAKHDALVSTFNNNNALSERIRRARAQVVNPRQLMSERGAQRLNAAENLALDFIMPFDRTPTNVIMRIVEASPAGYVKNAGQLVAAAIRKSMPQEHRRQFMQTFGNATTGTALMALGWYLADKAKGIIEVEESGNVALVLGGHRINLRTASPAGNILATGARLRVVRDNPESTWGDWAKPLLREPLNQPLLRSTSTLSEFARDPERSAIKTGARYASSMIPFSGAVRFAGEQIDSAENRYASPSSFKEQFQKNIPKWRESLPSERKGDFKKRLMEGMRRGESVDLDAAVASERITEADRKAIEREMEMTPAQARFENIKYADKALDRYERMNPTERTEVEEIMSRKAASLLESDAVTPTQKEKFRVRMEALGIEPKSPQRKSGTLTPSFEFRFAQGAP